MSQLIAVKVEKSLGTITDNLSEVAASVRAKVEEYKSIVVSEDNIADSKNLLANIRKDKTELDNSRKAIKKEWLAPYEEFEKRAKNVINLYDEPIGIIKEQLDEFEERRRADKRKAIKGIFDDVIGDMTEWLTLDDIYQSRWENASCSTKAIREDISMSIDATRMAISTIKSMGSEFEEDGLNMYKRTHDLQKAVCEMTSKARMKEDIIRREQEKAEAYARAKAEEVKEPETKEEVFVVPEEADGPFRMDKDVIIRVTIKESQFEQFKQLMEFNGYAYEVM